MKKTTKFINANPLVSVIMPVYNYEDYLSDAIESILKQTYANFELIIVDDASTDNSAQIIKKYQKRHHKKIKFISLKKNLNCGGDLCANEGIKVATGKYIARLDADDIALPYRLQQQVNFLEKNNDIFLVGSNAYVIDKKGKIIGEKIQPLTNEKIYKNYFTFHPMIHPSCMYRTYIKKGEKSQYKITYPISNDYYTFFDLICQGYKFANIADKLIYHRIHDKSVTIRNIKKVFFTMLKVRLAMIIKYRYRITAKGLLNNLTQTALVSLLPEKTILQLYFLIKGITKKGRILNAPFEYDWQ